MAIRLGTMRGIALTAYALGACALFTLSAQAPQPPPAPSPPAEQPAERLPLRNTGKPMVVEYHCSLDDIQFAGLSCTLDDPCPMYLELAAVEAVGNRIFLAGNIHSPSTTLYSVLLASDDAGKTWREPFERIRGVGLDHIQFVDFENGWISGEEQHPLPREPFLLNTSDGGRQWHLQPVFGEPRFGSILQFWFSSRSTGSLVVDLGQSGEGGRYALYETPNGGETWRQREANERPIQIKHAPDAGNADWRIRADRPTKSFHIERHTGERWQSIAGFSVSIGDCKPPPEPAPPPPPVEPASPPDGSTPSPQ
jgi:hypothetical protein